MGRRVLVVAAPTEADVAGIRRLARRLRPLGVLVAAAGECHGELRGERRRILLPNLLLVEARPEAWDALVLAGGAGAARVAEDQFARALAARAAQLGKWVGAWGTGARALDGVAGVACASPVELAARLAAHFTGAQ
jgi:hypothetical protein